MKNLYPTLEWMNAYQNAVNADIEMGIVGDWFSVDFKISFGDQEFLIGVRQGKIIEIEQSPRFDRPIAFTLRAPISVWRKFISTKPPPLYHDFFAMLMRVEEFQLDGNSLIAMQNARALHRMMNILKQMSPLDVSA